MVKAVIFDLDGTLVHIPIDYDALEKEFQKMIGETKLKPITEKIAKLEESKRRKIFKVWTKAELEALPNLAINEEGMRLYRKFSEKKLALVTMQGKTTVERILRTLDLSFEVIITRENSLNRAEQIKTALKKLGLKPAEVLMVGDRESDRASSEKVGCKFVKVEDRKVNAPR